MGLQIHSRACAHFGDANSDMVMRASILLGEGAAERKAFKATRPMIEPIGEWRTDYFGMHIPKKSPDCAFVDVIARVPYNPSYAPIVREGNCMMICLDAHPTLWTDEFKAIVQEVGTTLLDRKLEPFTRAKRPVSAAGVHAFKLAKSGDTDELSGHHLYFKFDKPVTFRAKVEHTGSKSLMFLFMGENSECWHREDASNGESLELKVSITQKQLDSIKDGYWELKVSNFDANNTAEGKIEVKIDNP
jgi:hypothetical protein